MPENMIDGVSAEKLFGMLGNYFNGVGARIRKGEMGEVLREMELFSNRLNPFPSADSYLGEWAMFLNKVFGRTFDLSGAAVPGDKRSFERMLVRPQGPTMNEMLQACRRGWQGRPGFPVRSAYGDDLDAHIPEHERTADKGSYAIRCRNSREADEELKNKSGKDIRKMAISTMTVPERLLYEIKYYDETGEHLDVKNITLCSGSRDSAGSVPYVYWYSGGMYIFGCPPRDVCSVLRAREVVS